MVVLAPAIGSFVLKFRSALPAVSLVPTSNSLYISTVSLSLTNLFDFRLATTQDSCYYFTALVVAFYNRLVGRVCSPLPLRSRLYFHLMISTTDVHFFCVAQQKESNWNHKCVCVWGGGVGAKKICRHHYFTLFYRLQQLCSIIIQRYSAAASLNNSQFYCSNGTRSPGE